MCPRLVDATSNLTETHPDLVEARRSLAEINPKLLEVGNIWGGSFREVRSRVTSVGTGLTRLGFGRTSVPAAPFDARYRLRGVTLCRLHRCSSKSELCQADSAQISGGPPSGHAPSFPTPLLRAPQIESWPLRCTHGRNNAKFGTNKPKLGRAIPRISRIECEDTQQHVHTAQDPTRPVESYEVWGPRYFSEHSDPYDWVLLATVPALQSQFVIVEEAPTQQDSACVGDFPSGGL